MTDESKNKISPQTIAIGLLIIGALGWYVLNPVESPEPDDQAAVFTPIDAVDDQTNIWSTYHGGPTLTGATSISLPDELSVAWRFQADSSIYQTPVSSENRIFFSTRRGGVYALDMEGNEVWSKRLVQELRRDGTPRMERFDAPLSCFGSTVLAGSLNGTLFALDAESGEEKWKYDVGGPILGSPNLHPASDLLESDRVYVINQEDGVLHSIDLETGMRLWQTEGVERCDGSPAVGGNIIAYGSCASALHVYSAVDGSLLRNIEFDEESQVAGGVAITGQSVFAGSHSGRLFHADLTTGEILWMNESSEDEIFTTPAVNDEWVIFGSYDDNVYALDRATGELKWTFNSEGLPVSPVIASDKVLVSSDGMLYMLTLKTGEVIASYEVSDEITSPALINGMIVVGSDDGTVTAFGQPKQ